MKIWLDDKREMPAGYDYWAKNAYDCIDRLHDSEVAFISFDHDLGSEGKDDSGLNTGYNVAQWIEAMAFEGSISKIGWEVHSANPVGRRNIELAMKSAERFWEGK